MKAKALVVGGLLAGVMVVATSVVASANVVFCMDDPPVQVVTPAGHNLTVHNQVYMSADSRQLLNDVSDQATAQPDGRGGTLITDTVYVPAPARVVATVNQYNVRATGSGTTVVTLLLDVPIS